MKSNGQSALIVKVIICNVCTAWMNALPAKPCINNPELKALLLAHAIAIPKQIETIVAVRPLQQ